MRDVLFSRLRSGAFAGVVALLASVVPTASSSREAALPASDPKLEQLGQSWEEGLKKGMALVIMAAPSVPVGKEMFIEDVQVMHATSFVSIAAAK